LGFDQPNLADSPSKDQSHCYEQNAEISRPKKNRLNEGKFPNPYPSHGDREKEEFVGYRVQDLTQVASPAKEAGDKSVEKLGSQGHYDYRKVPADGQERKGDGQDQPNNGDTIGDIRTDAGLNFSHRDGLLWWLGI
tara:strand:- start:861 stop:1268 length:408 start_codon:yes stop_codon:yes gene_type:complete